MIEFFFIPIFLVWGSFLNFVGYRIIHQRSLLQARSRCPKCNFVIAWHDLIPVISWLFLKGKCRFCKKQISILYPFIELLTTVVFCHLLVSVSAYYWPAYFCFFSALIICIRTDLETMLLHRATTLGLIPLGIIFSYFNLTPISLFESIFGAVSAYAFLWTVAAVYYKITKRVGMGLGDIELLAGIGSFIGFIGWWLSLLIGSSAASIIGLFYILFYKTSLRAVKLPFGPFLALGAIIYALHYQFFISFIMRNYC